MIKRSQQPHRGFTLIELMVVISIVGLISSVVLAALNSARVRARDTQRIQALGEIRKALTLYYDDNGVYPSPREDNTYPGAGTSYATNSLDTACPPVVSATVSWGCLQRNLNAAKTYISKLPQDPASTCSTCGIFGSASYYSYRYDVSPNGAQYSLIVRFEQPNSLMCSTDDLNSKYRGLFNTPSNYIQSGTPLCGTGSYDIVNTMGMGSKYFYYITGQ